MTPSYDRMRWKINIGSSRDSPRKEKVWVRVSTRTHQKREEQAEKEALRNAQDEHICATLHNCEGNCERRHSISHQGEEEGHVHVQCEHGFVLISGIRDNTLQPECSNVKYKAEGERWLRSQRLLPEPSTALFVEKVKGEIDVACSRVPKMSQETLVQHGEQQRQAVGAKVSPTLSARQMLEEERESFTITDAMEYLCDDSPAFSSAYVGVGAGIGAIGSFKTKKFKPKWSAEVNPIQQGMWNVLTAVMCLGNFFELDPAFLPWVFLLVITLPCTDFSTGGSQRGDQGETGWMYLAAVRQVLAMPTLPEVVEIETADGIMTTNNGREL